MSKCFETIILTMGIFTMITGGLALLTLIMHLLMSVLKVRVGYAIRLYDYLINKKAFKEWKKNKPSPGEDE
jgi:hypothetical protein